MAVRGGQLEAMTVFPDTKQIVIPYRADVEAFLGTNIAQRFEARGAWWLAITHDVETVRLLRNCGVPTPSPALHYYNWSGGNPFDSQKSTVDMCSVDRRAYVLSEMGVGKTRAVLWAYDYLRSVGKAKRLLVVAPLSTLTTVWENEIFENFYNLRAVVLYGDRKKRQKLLAIPADVYIINHEGVEVLQQDLYARADIDTVIIDELASYRNSRSLRWKNLEPIVRRSQYAWGLTGTPTVNAPTDAYGQAKLLTPASVGYSFKAFKDRTMVQKGMFKWIERPEAIDIVHSVMQPAVRFTRDQCFDLPPTTYSTRQVQLPAPCLKAYNEMVDKLHTEVNNNQINAANEGVKLSKLLQIAAGFAYDVDGVGRYIGGMDRFRELIDIIDQSTGKVIVFASFRYMVELMNGVLKKRYDVGMIHGEVPKAKRDQIFSDFQRASTPRVIVAHPVTMSHGLTLTAANTVVWATPVNSLETYLQANARVTRSGQQQNTHIIHLTGTKAETQVYQRLKRKEKFQGTLLELFEK